MVFKIENNHAFSFLASPTFVFVVRKLRNMVLLSQSLFLILVCFLFYFVISRIFVKKKLRRFISTNVHAKNKEHNAHSDHLLMGRYTNDQDGESEGWRAFWKSLTQIILVIEGLFFNFIILDVVMKKFISGLKFSYALLIQT